MEFEITYYQNSSGRKPVEEFLLDLGKKNLKLQAKAFKGIELLRSKTYHVEPLSKYIESGLWELRIKSINNILRIFYTFRKGKIIILIHVFIKRRQKTPLRELEIARNRLNEIKLMEVN